MIELDDPTVKPLGCVPGGLIDTRNADEMKRRRERGLWVWEWWSYENELRWEKTRAEVIAGLEPDQRKALGYE